MNKKIFTLFLTFVVFFSIFFVVGAQSNFTPAEVDAYIREYGFGRVPTDPTARLMGQMIQDYINSNDDYKTYSADELDDLYERNADFRNSFLSGSSRKVDEETTHETYDPQPLPTPYNDGTDDPTKENFQIVPSTCFGTGDSISNADNKNYGKCGWKDIIALLNRMIKFMAYIAASLSAIAFAYAGFLYMTAAGNSGKIEQAHGVFKKTFIGIFFVLVGYLLVATILKTLGVDNTSTLLDISGTGGLGGE